MAIRRISNIASIDLLEKTFKRKLVYPDLYEPTAVIDGAEENSLTIISGNRPESITYSIWGLLPQLFKRDWYRYQSIYPSLQLNFKDLNKFKKLNEFEHIWPCLIIITGFFIYHYLEDDLIPILVNKTNKEPFCVAGIGSTLSDGFQTCSLLTHHAHGVIENIQNKYDQQPIIIEKKFYDYWLSSNLEISAMKTVLKFNKEEDLSAYSISKNFADGLSTSRPLQPVFYKELPDF